MPNLTCRGCKSPELQPILSFGSIPVADILLTEEQLDEPELIYPLELVFCSDCSLVQLTVVVPPEILYSEDYPYYSSVSSTLMTHFSESAYDIMASKDLSADSLVIEIASNDGYMLKEFVERGIPVLGIDPAQGPAARAEQQGVPTLCSLFDHDLALRLREQGSIADVILANNVLNLVSDIGGFVAGLKLLLKTDGTAVIEVPYAVNIISRGEFDMIFHQNLSYFSLSALDRLFRQQALYVNRVEQIPTFGGSLRLFVEHRLSPRGISIIYPGR